MTWAQYDKTMQKPLHSLTKKIDFSYNLQIQKALWKIN